MLSETEQAAWDEVVEACRHGPGFPLELAYRIPLSAILSVNAELLDLRAKVAVVEGMGRGCSIRRMRGVDWWEFRGRENESLGDGDTPWLALGLEADNDK